VEGSRAEITEISATPPATDSGLKPGDILLQVGKVKVREPEDVLDASFFLTAGDVVPITVAREGEKITFDVQADVHPAVKNVPMLPDGTQLPAAATLKFNRAIPLSLQPGSQRTP
jgi:predicted metalloprotease with PDZ domain